MDTKIERVFAWCNQQLQTAIYAMIEFVFYVALGYGIAYVSNQHMDTVLIVVFYAYIFNNRASRIT